MAIRQRAKKRNYVLILDSSHRGELIVALANGRLRVLRHQFDTPGSGQLLNLVEQLLHREKISLHELIGIVVASGPGPFSALRASAAIANAMGYALDIPAVGAQGELPLKELARRGAKKLARAKPGVIVVPHYDRPANITKAKRRFQNTSFSFDSSSSVSERSRDNCEPTSERDPSLSLGDDT